MATDEHIEGSASPVLPQKPITTDDIRLSGQERINSAPSQTTTEVVSQESARSKVGQTVGCGLLGGLMSAVGQWIWDEVSGMM
ncbi:hypothetical protein Q7P37_008101 [Cladosporium fusiforme]